MKSQEQITKILNSLNITIVNSTHNPDDFNYDKQVKLKNLKRNFFNLLNFSGQ